MTFVAPNLAWAEKNRRPKDCAEFGLGLRCSSVTAPLAGDAPSPRPAPGQIGRNKRHRISPLDPSVPRVINTTTFVASIVGSGEARRGSIPRSGAVNEEQRSQNRKATQPSGRRFFLAPTLLLTPYRPLKGMRVARASSGPKIPRRKRGRIYEMGY